MFLTRLSTKPGKRSSLLIHSRIASPKIKCGIANSPANAPQLVVATLPLDLSVKV